MSMFSLWSLILYVLIPFAVILLILLLLCPPSLKQHALQLVEQILFTTFGGRVPVPFIKFVIGFFVLTTAVMGFSVYQYETDHHDPKDFQSALMSQSKGFRQQRNLYLSGQCLVLYWMLYTVYIYEKKLAGDRVRGPSIAAPNAAARVSAPKSD